jgi:hypothetical protein
VKVRIQSSIAASGGQLVASVRGACGGAEDRVTEDGVTEDRGAEDRGAEDRGGTEDRVAEDRGAEDRVTEGGRAEGREAVVAWPVIEDWFCSSVLCSSSGF